MTAQAIGRVLDDFMKGVDDIKGLEITLGSKSAGPLKGEAKLSLKVLNGV